MRVAFINSTFEPGKDGPGDYTRQLAGELHRRGWSCGQFSFADRNQESILREIQNGIPTLRCSKKIAWENRMEIIRQGLLDFRPDVLSLGIVCYALHPKGFVGRFAPLFSSLNPQKIPWHLFYQEIWIGAHQEASWKHRLVGYIQKKGLVRFAKHLKPRGIDCWNPVHQACLKKAGVESGIMPVMSTVPIMDSTQPSEEWKTISSQIGLTEPRDRYWCIGFFGTLHPEWPSEPLFSRMHAIAQEMGKKLIWIALGDLRSGKSFWNRLKEENRHRFEMIERGELGFEKLSIAIHELDFAVATTPWQILGKSSTASAFLEHGIPLLVNREEPYGFNDEIEGFNDSLAIRLDEEFENRVKSVKKRAPQAKLPEIADLFMARMKGCQ